MFANKYESSRKYHPLEPLQQMEDEWGLDLSETSEDRIKFLKREFRFLDIFLSFQSFIGEIKLLEVTRKVQALSRVADVDLRKVNQIQHVDGATSRVQDSVLMAKSEIRDEYCFPSVPSKKEGIITPRSVMQFVDTGVENLGNLLKIYSSKSLLYVPGPKKELSDVFKELKLLRNFVCFVSDRCKVLHRQQSNFFTHVLLVAGHAAMVAWLYLPSNSKENQLLSAPGEMNNLLSDLLQMRIKPIQPGVRKVYIDVLQALRSAVQSQVHPIIQIEHLADCGAGFVETLQYNLKALPTVSNSTRIVALADQIAVFHEMLSFLISNIIPLYLHDLVFHRPEIDYVIVDSALLVYSLYDSKEEMEDVALGEIIQCIKMLIYRIIRKEFQSYLPRIHGLGYVDFLLNNLKEFQERYSDSLAFVESQLRIIQMELECLQPFLKSVIVEQRNKYDKLQHSVGLLIGKAYEVEYIVDACVSKKVPDWCLMLWLMDIAYEIKAEVSEIQKIKMVEVDLNFHDSMNSDIIQTSSELVETTWVDEEFVGFQDEIKTLMYRLIRGNTGLEVISIVSMAGSGKTTLANRLYNDSSVMHHFDIQMQCHISPVYSLRGMLLSILACVPIGEFSLPREETDELGHMLRIYLHNKRYLILLDDVRDLRAWKDLRRYLPDLYRKSRILLTTRHCDVAQYATTDAEPLYLRLFDDVESWKLLQKKVFGDERCSPLLENVGQGIARKCQGLPLSIVLVAGILAKMEKTKLSWRQVARDLGSFIDLEAIVEKSYQSLPYHLKPCFLYFATFLEDKEIEVPKLTWLWIGEGFLKEHEDKSLEDIAEGYLENLIRRNLVMVANTSSGGKLKACRVHDVLYEFCRKKTEEEYLLLWMLRTGSHKQLVQHCLVFNDVDNLERSSSCPHVGSVLYREDTSKYVSTQQLSRILDNFKFLKVLDLESIVISSFPTTLVYLRYFAAQIAQECIPLSIANLWNLQTFILKTEEGKLTLPTTLWKMVKLRHVHIDNACFSLKDGEELLENLETLSSPYFSCAKDVELLSRKAPNLRVLRCSFVDCRHECFPKLDSLTRLEALQIHLAADSMIDGPYNFPSSLRKLTLSNFFLGSCHMSTISKLPNLHVLKLVSIFFENDKWEASDDEFQTLKVLKLVKCEFFEEWQASENSFPSLEHLVLRECTYLEEIPICFGDSRTLKSITVKSCNESIDRSATYIREIQVEDNMNIDFNIFIQKEKRDGYQV